MEEHLRTGGGDLEADAEDEERDQPIEDRFAPRPEVALDAQPAPYFTGEAVFPWMLDELLELTVLREVANVLAKHDNWPPLYDVARLEANTVPVVGTVYWDEFAPIVETVTPGTPATAYAQIATDGSIQVVGKNPTAPGDFYSFDGVSFDSKH